MEEPDITSVMTQELVFYDPDYFESCREFCEKRDISYLPHVDGNSLYHYEDMSFVEVQDFQEFQVQDDIHLFDDELKEKLVDKKVLFVYDGAILRGVIHFADYNANFVYKYLYNSFFELENYLRTYLELKELDNEDLLSHLVSKRDLDKEEKIQNLKEKMNSRKSFQEAGLKDLFDLINSHNLNLNLPEENLRELRNQVMHEKQFVEHKDFEEKEMHYDLSTFKEFFGRVNDLRESIRKTKNKIQLNNQMAS